MLFKVWQGDLRKAVTADPTHMGLWFAHVCNWVNPGTGTSLSIFASVSRNFIGFHAQSECSCHAQGVGVGVKLSIPIYDKELQMNYYVRLFCLIVS